MSYLGRRVVASIDRRYRAARKREREGKLHGWERLGILGGELETILRDVEPGVSKGQQIVLLRSQTKRTALYDDHGRLTGEVSVTPSHPLFGITITSKRRHSKGGWEITFDTFDARDRDYFIRRTPPAARQDIAQQAPTAEEIAMARIESAYTTDPRQALERLSAPLSKSERKIAMQTRLREAERAKHARREETTRRDVRSVTAQVREVATGIVRIGGDPEPFLVEIQRIIDAQRQEAEAA